MQSRLSFWLLLLSSALCTSVTAVGWGDDNAELSRRGVDEVHVSLVARLLPFQITSSTSGSDTTTATATTDTESTATPESSSNTDASTSSATTIDDSSSTSSRSITAASTTTKSKDSSSSLTSTTVLSSSTAPTVALAISTTDTTSATPSATNTKVAADSNAVPFSKNAGAIAATAVLLVFLVAGIAGIAWWQIRVCLAQRRDKKAEALQKAGGYAALRGSGDDVEGAAGSHDMAELAPAAGLFRQHTTALVSSPPRPPMRGQASRGRGAGYERVVPNHMDGSLHSHPHSRSVSNASSAAPSTQPYHSQQIARSAPPMARSDSFARSMTPPHSVLVGPAGLPSQRGKRQRSGSSMRSDVSTLERSDSPPTSAIVRHSQGEFVPQKRVKSFSANVIDGEGVARTSPVSTLDHYTGWTGHV